VICAGKLDKIRREHPELSLGCQQAPAGVAGSIAVMSLGYSDGSKVAVLDALDKEGNPVIAAILP
jgi:hypothetical protein